MSMSQEEIEALMSGAGDIAHEEGEELQEDVSIEDIEETPAESEESADETEEITLEDLEEEKVSDSSDDTEDSIEEPIETEEPVEEVIEASEPSSDEEEEDNNLDNLDDILAGIDGIVDDDVSESTPEESASQSSEDADEKIENLIEQSQYPFPAKDENKVVNQLNQVADDSEEKASQIFDVLSFILDENSEIQNYNKDMGNFIEDQVKLLESLSTKFPNITVFAENLEKAKELSVSSKDLDDKVNGENNKIFEAMELMQYHDINRQKIERVMSVIKKLNSYLNGIFEDESDKPEVQIAKHISGDSNEIVDADDIESLISEFSEQ